MKQKEIYIIGDLVFGAQVAELAEELGYKIAGYVLMPEFMSSAGKLNWPILEKMSDIPKGSNVALGHSSNRFRHTYTRKIYCGDWNMPNLIHPSAKVSPNASMLKGCIIFENVKIRSYTQLGRAVVVKEDAIIFGNVTIEDACTIGVRTIISEGVTIGYNTGIGSNVFINPSISIGIDAGIGNHSLVHRNVSNSQSFSGNAANFS